MSQLTQKFLCPLPSYCPSSRAVLPDRRPLVHALLNKSHLPRIQMPSLPNYSRSEIKIRFYFVFPSLIRNIEPRSRVLTFGKIKFHLLFHSLIRTFADDFMNMWIDLGCLQPQKKMLKEKTCLAYAHRTFTHSALFLSPYIIN